MAPWWEGPLAGWDLETTSPEPFEARIVTSTIVKTDPASSETDVREWLVNPGVEIPQGAIDVHGVTNERAQAEGANAAYAVKEILTHLRLLLADGIPLVVYNAAYDFTVLQEEALRYGLEPLDPRPVIDPHVIDKKLDRYRPGKRTLSVTCGVFKIPMGQAHTSAADAVAAVDLARHFGRTVKGAPEDARDLHDAQIGWRRFQAEGLEEHFRRSNPTAWVAKEWPIQEPEPVTA